MRSIKDMLVLYGLAFIIAMFGLWLIFQTDSGQYLLDDTVPLNVVTPEQCTEDMDCWACESMGNGICGPMP